VQIAHDSKSHAAFSDIGLLRSIAKVAGRSTARVASINYQLRVVSQFEMFPDVHA